MCGLCSMQIGLLHHLKHGEQGGQTAATVTFSPDRLPLPCIRGT